MVKVESNNGEVNLLEIEGTEKRIIGDIGALAHKILLTLANTGAKSKEELFLKYGILARQLVNYIEETVKRVEEIASQQE